MSVWQLPLHLVEEFLETGVCVIPAVLSDDEVSAALDGLHRYDGMLARSGFNSEDMETTASSLSSLSATRGAGGILEIYYEDWKLRLAEHPRVVKSIQTLWQHSYAAYGRENGSVGERFAHPFGDFDSRQGFMYIDRICYRLPQKIIDSVAATTAVMDSTDVLNVAGISVSRKKVKRRLLQRSLGPHLDCCPHRMYDPDYITKWRPIQAFVSLSDSLNCNEGGFEACPGLHARFPQWTAERSARMSSLYMGTTTEPPCVGQFTPIRPVEDQDIMEGFRPISCRRGDLVCWDFRIPHANARFNHSHQPRIVVYIGMLPNVPLNVEYARRQLAQFQSGEVPCDQWQEIKMGRQYCAYEFSELGKKLMHIKQWS